MGQPSSKVCQQAELTGLIEEPRAGTLKHPCMTYYTAKMSDRCHQQELCPDLLNNSLLIRIVSALQIQLNHASDFFAALETLKYTVKVFFFFVCFFWFFLNHC